MLIGVKVCIYANSFTRDAKLAPKFIIGRELHGFEEFQATSNSPKVEQLTDLVLCNTLDSDMLDLLLHPGVLSVITVLGTDTPPRYTIQVSFALLLRPVLTV